MNIYRHRRERSGFGPYTVWTSEVPEAENDVAVLRPVAGGLWILELRNARLGSSGPLIGWIATTQPPTLDRVAAEWSADERLRGYGFVVSHYPGEPK